MTRPEKFPKRPTRIGVSLQGTLTTFDDRQFVVRVRDLSAGGCKVDLPDAEKLLAWENVTLAIGGNEKLAGQVRWTSGTQAGVIFLAPPPPL